MKNEKGITLTSLVVYVVILFIIIAMFGVIRNSFESSIKDISEDASNESEFNKFNIYFGKDVKTNGNKATLNSANKITFSSGNSYEYESEGKTIYLKNAEQEIPLLRDVDLCTFSINTSTGKTVITASILFVGADNPFTKEYVVAEDVINVYENEEDYIVNAHKNTRLPSDYVEVEYIESTGTQYIDTGFKPRIDTSIDITFRTNASPNDTNLWGSRISSGNQDYTIWINTSTNKAIALHFPKQSGSMVDTSWVYKEDIINNKTNLKINSTVSSLEILVNGVSVYSKNDLSKTSYEPTLNSFLFCMNQNGSTQKKGNFKIYSCKIYDGGTPVRDLVPCYRIRDEVAGMYDLVNNVFYTNAYNSGDDFIVGPEV